MQIFTIKVLGIRLLVFNQFKRCLQVKLQEKGRKVLSTKQVGKSSKKAVKKPLLYKTFSYFCNRKATEKENFATG